MTEINNNLPAKPASGNANTAPSTFTKPKRAEGPRVTNAQANSISGLASGLNTKQTIDTIMQIEKRRLEPVEFRRAETQVELDAFTKVNEDLETLQASAQLLADRSIWEGKLVESSDESVVTATATTGAKPGKNNLIVDKLALNHQIASQRYKDSNVDIGTGDFKITVGEEAAVTVVIDSSNSTLNGLKDAINTSQEDVRATIINTGDKEVPNQLVLTSQKTGSEGRIFLEIDMRGGKPPNFASTIDEPSDWAGVDPEVEREAVPTGTGASTTIVRIIGDNTSEDDHIFTFTAVQTGIIGGENALQMRWKDDTGRSGVLELDTFNYAPGEPIEFADGLSLIFSQGEMIVGDEFTISTNSEQSPLLWWIDSEDRKAGFGQPEPWARQAEFGAPVVEGDYSNEEDQEFTLTVEGGGQVGSAGNLSIRWQAENGESGTLRVGKGYQPGSQLAIADGLTLSLNPGVLLGGAVATFTAIASETTTQWWKSDSERDIPSQVLDISSFEKPEVDEDEEDEARGIAGEPEFPLDLGPRVSSSEVQITGTYTADESKVYTFTVFKDGSVGTTTELLVRWVDDKGDSGEMTIGDDYKIGSPLLFDSGLSVSFGAGRIFEEDFFTVRTRTSTIQPAQDALIRFGATELGGGIEITNSTNEFDNVIEGVKLTLVKASEDPVTISVTGDKEKAAETVIQFGTDFNRVALLINELTKFDPDSKEAGILLGDNDLTQIRTELNRLIMDPVAGLPNSRNMVFGLGIVINNKGVLEINEETIRAAIADDFAAVADIFRAKGESDNSAISFVSMTEDTRSNPDGYVVDITRAASRGSYLTSSLAGVPIQVTERTGTVVLVVDGLKSEDIVLEPGSYSIEEYARQLQNGITNDKVVGERRVRVTTEGDRIRITSGRYGSRSSMEIEAPGGVPSTLPGLADGFSDEGLDTEGSIDGKEAEGIGQLLKASDDSPTVKGMRLIVDLPPNLVIPNAPEAVIKITKGVGSKLAKHIKDLLDPRVGNMRRITTTLRSAIGEIDKQLEQMNERIERKRVRIQTKFVRLESKMSSLKSQQGFMAGQLGGLPGGGKGAKGLPGL